MYAQMLQNLERTRAAVRSSIINDRDDKGGSPGPPGGQGPPGPVGPIMVQTPWVTPDVTALENTFDSVGQCVLQLAGA